MGRFREEIRQGQDDYPEVIMSRRAVDLAERFKASNMELIGFVESCTDGDWRKECPDEGWPVGVVVRHIAASHYGAVRLAKMMAAGEKLPELTGAAVDQMNAKHAEKHRDCTRGDVLKILRENGRAVVDFVTGLSDADLDRTGHVAAAGGDLTMEQLISVIIVQSCGEHIAHAKAAAGASAG